MKIIGKRNGGFIVDASEDELVHICGFNYEHERRVASTNSKGRCGSYAQLEVGDNIEVAQIWNMLKNIQSYERKLIEAKATLAAVINGVDMVAPVVKAVAEFESEASPADEVSRL